ncbi:DUF771 domain-containing protein [Staphylococcus pseudintermedius]|uniref:DUF771 domain-containing protein n=1 Tax=Staphylococcus pseudintermedius TaxID=283734 RepID=UPI002152A47C|nr:DUF771 domain-containing protein [Staphylococcus pseudintermedius]MDA3098635.1 DUF771 domain-containing protein [Staphylococcus pseudintermedius]MDK3740454.1 DUF771 domain-containing protein [Staphylococcus pseudintermedius]MDK3942524.1 DUF771 domain-containing protein [Staphylococcus pseudintermedius]MDT0781668.1 DUF771 domain-containing protein [Staphylococcus pseudintermedius]MDT0848176.1 DUF771 domain-containing protein [Staphylococcus pseudintermedius]
MAQQKNKELANMTTKTFWYMDDLIEEVGRGRKWIKDNILNIPKFKKEIEEFSHYPINNNDEYIFVGSKMKNWLEDNFKEIERLKYM